MRRLGALSVLRTRSGALALSLVGGAATAGVAAAYLGQAWNGFAHCRGSAKGGACPTHPFWGLSPEFYLLACLVGVAAGALIVLVGLFAARGRFRSRPAGELLVALSALGILAYGGFGVGAAAGVAAGAVLIASRSSRPAAPSEWSGSFPVGVPPAPRGARRTMSGRPPVTEWDGIVATAPYGPPGAGRSRISLPQADRLAAALERSRIAAPRQGSGPVPPPPVVVLPPPPLGLRSSFRGVPPPAPSAPAATARAGTVPGTPAPALGIPPAPSASPTSSTTWRPEPSEVSPWSTATAAPRSSEVAPPVRPAASGHDQAGMSPLLSLAAASAALPRGAAVSSKPAPRPLREFTPPPAPAPGVSTTAEAARVAPAGPAGGGATTAPGTGLAYPIPAPLPPPRPSESVPLTGPTGPTPPPLAFPVAAPPAIEPNRPPPPTGPAVKGRVRAWKCPNCGLVNAPWSDRCTGCKIAAPSFA